MHPLISLEISLLRAEKKLIKNWDRITFSLNASCELSGLPRRAGMLRSNKNEVENDRSGVVNMISFEHKAKWTRFKFLKLRIIKCLMVL